MTNGIPLTAEIVKMAQLRSRATGCDVRQETARQIAQQAILELDPELDLLIDEESAYSSDDRLLATFDLSDLVVNGVRLDVRVLADDGRISIPRYLVGTSYMNGGTLAVSFNADRTAAIVGYVPRSDWELQDKHAGSKEDKLVFRINGPFDLSKLPAILASVQHNESRNHRANLHSTDIAQFCGHRQEMKLSQQRDFVDAVLHNQNYWSDLESGISKVFVKKTLVHAAVWNQKLENLSEKMLPKFKNLNKEEVKKVIAKIGERVGGHIESAQFRRDILLNLSKEELARSLAGEQLHKANKLIEQIFSGRSVVDGLKELVKSKTAIDLALSIKRQRQKLAGFVEASSDEIAFAFRQLALQPVYATHSQDSEGIESVNEALKLLEAAELAEELKALESELSV